MTEADERSEERSEERSRERSGERAGSTSGQGSGESPDRPRKRAARKAPSRGEDATDRASSGARGSRRGGTGPVAVARSVGRQLEELSGKRPEAVTAVESTDDGWRLHLEVVESRRVPDSADILALYEVEADTDGDLTGYRRLRRYARGHTGDDPGGRG